MKSSDIIIIGGGISGLTTLHALKKKQPHLNVTLLEAWPQAGGTVFSEIHGSCLFEHGPNGFIPEQETINLIKEIGLSDQLLPCNEEAKTRYVCAYGNLHKVPQSLGDLLKFKLLTLPQKLRILAELFIKTRNFPHESLYDFIARRFGQAVADQLLDPAINGIFAGDVKQLSACESFSKLVQWESEHGSIIKGMIKSIKAKKQLGLPRGTHSFKNGMFELINVLQNKYLDSIKLACKVTAIKSTDNGYEVLTEKDSYHAKQIILATPAYGASDLLKDLNPNLASSLDNIVYAPVGVVGLAYPKEAVPEHFNGFGYLIPSNERNPVLGVLCESNVFSNRSPKDFVMFRVMIGGMHQGQVLNYGEEHLFDLAQTELRRMLRIMAEPSEKFIRVWDKAIPQYDMNYVHWKKTIADELKNHPGLHLQANYLGGISFNDCIKNANALAESIELKGEEVDEQKEFSFS